MNNLLTEIANNVNLEEGKNMVESVLLSIFFKEGISIKEISREVLLPVPIVAAIKNELKKKGIIAQDNGTRLTQDGKKFINFFLKYESVNNELYSLIMNDSITIDDVFKEEIDKLREVFEGRPQVDVTIDQSKCTVETSIKRALLCLKYKSLIGKRILCVGDDDLVSVSLGFLAKKLISNGSKEKCTITVLDLDERFLVYIDNIAKKEDLPIECNKVDLRQPIEDRLLNQYDCFFTDPPYTMSGMELFVSRGLSALKKESGLPIFLSFAHKPPEFTINMQRAFLDMGLAILEILPRFNKYEGSEIIGNVGQMIVLKSTSKTKPMIEGIFNEALYTGEIKRTIRIYQCKRCKKRTEVGFSKKYKTIEELKELGCQYCRGSSFDLLRKVLQKN